MLDRAIISAGLVNDKIQMEATRAAPPMMLFWALSHLRIISFWHCRSGSQRKPDLQWRTEDLVPFFQPSCYVASHWGLLGSRLGDMTEVAHRRANAVDSGRADVVNGSLEIQGPGWGEISRSLSNRDGMVESERNAEDAEKLTESIGSDGMNSFLSYIFVPSLYNRMSFPRSHDPRRPRHVTPPVHQRRRDELAPNHSDHATRYPSGYRHQAQHLWLRSIHWRAKVGG